MRAHKRPYQQECSDSIVDHFWKQGVTCQGISLPCGAGKTVCVSTLPEDIGLLPGESLLFMAHREELIDQAADKFRFYNPDLTIEIERATERAMPDADVVIASVQSLTPSRIKKFDPSRFRVVVTDETLHAFSSSMYQRIMEYFEVHKSRSSFSRQKLLVGLTATWRRGDGVGSEHLYDKIIFHKSIRDVMQSGIYAGDEWCPYLAPIRGHRELSEMHLDKVHVSKGKLEENELALAMNTPERNEQVVDTYLEIGEGMPALAFTVNIQHSIDLAAAFQKRGLLFEAVSGDKSRTGDRRPVIDAYLGGQIRGLCSAQAISEGTDLPLASVGLNCCPTLSPSQYTQKFGRITRPFPAPEERLKAHQEGRQIPWVKPYGIWIDFTDSSTKHNLVQAPTLFGLRPDFDLKGKDIEETVKAIEEAKAKNPSLDTRKLRSLDDLTRSSVSFAVVDQPQESPEIRKWSRYPWLVESPDQQWALAIRGTNSVLRVRREDEKSFSVWHYLMGSGSHRKTETTLRQAIISAETLLGVKEKKILRRDAPWRRDPPTPPQCHSLWAKDADLRRRFRSGDAFYSYAHGEHERGNTEFSKGSVADRLNVYLASNRIFGPQNTAKKQNWVSKIFSKAKEKLANVGQH